MSSPGHSLWSFRQTLLISIILVLTVAVPIANACIWHSSFNVCSSLGAIYFKLVYKILGSLPDHFRGTYHHEFPKTGQHRSKFLIQCVQDLRASLKKRGSQLIVRSVLDLAFQILEGDALVEWSKALLLREKINYNQPTPGHPSPDLGIFLKLLNFFSLRT